MPIVMAVAISCGLTTSESTLLGHGERGDRNSYKESMRDVLGESTMPVDVESVRSGAGLTN